MRARMPADDGRPFVHSKYPDGPPLASGRARGWFESRAIVGHHRAHGLTRARDAHPDMRCARMLRDIREGLLKDAEENDLHFRRKACAEPVGVDLDRYARHSEHAVRTCEDGRP